MLNVIFYSPTKDEELEYKTYDVNGKEIIIKEMTQVNRPISFACDTLVNGDSLFAYNFNIQEFNGQMPSVVSASSMFECTNITSVHFNDELANFGSLKNGESMFAECPNLDNVKIDCKLLVNGKKMFYKTPITTLEASSFESVLYGQYMFSQTALTSFEYNLPSLIDGSYLFSDCSSLTSFNGKLSNVRILDNSFYNNTNLTTFVTDSLDNIESATSAFYKTKISEWKYNLPSLKNAENMFKNCSNLVTFIGDLSSLKNGSSMFSSASLTTFQSPLTKLEIGDGMFSGCRLTPQSVMFVLDSIPTHMGGEHNLGMGIACANTEDAKNVFAEQAGYNDWQTMTDYVTNKGWTVTWKFNN